MTPSTPQALRGGAVDHALQAGQRLLDRAVDVRAVVRLARAQEARDRLEALAQRQRVVEAPLVRDQHAGDDAVGQVDATQDLGRVGQLRHDVRPHERRDLEAAKAGARERVDQAHLVVGGDDLRLVLEPVARPDLADAHCTGEAHARSPVRRRARER